MFENRPEEAADKYEQALNLPITQQLTADIYNQQALLLLAQNKAVKARKVAEKALLLQQKSENKYAEALSLQLLSQIVFKQEHYRLAVKYAETAEKIYESRQNLSARLECLYLKASALYRQKRLATAENLLRRILQLGREQKNNFHLANAYSLLGLIYMQTGDYQRAKVLFQQSLRLEQSHQRCEGLVADYNNLAIIEHLSGNNSEARNNLQAALEYAKQTGDDNLVKLIEKRCENIT